MALTAPQTVPAVILQLRGCCTFNREETTVAFSTGAMSSTTVSPRESGLDADTHGVQHQLNGVRQPIDNTCVTGIPHHEGPHQVISLC